MAKILDFISRIASANSKNLESREIFTLESRDIDF